MKRRTGFLSFFAAAALVASVLVPSATKAAVACAPAEHPGGDWRMYGHDNANTRSQPAETTIGRLEAPFLGPVWTFSASAAGGSGDFTGTPTVADGCVYVGSNDGWVFAMNADTGELVWKAEVPDGGGINSSIVTEDVNGNGQADNGEFAIAIVIDGAGFVTLLEMLL